MERAEGACETYAILDNGAASLEVRVYRGTSTAVVSCTVHPRTEVLRARFRQVWVGQNWSRFRGPWGVPGHCCSEFGEDVAGQCVLWRAEHDEPDTSRPVYYWVLDARVDRFTTDPDDPVVHMESCTASREAAYPFVLTAKAAVLLPFADRHHPDMLVKIPHATLFQLACQEMADRGHDRMLSPADTFFHVEASVVDPLTTYHPVTTVYTTETK